MRQLARRTGIVPAAIYNHFPSKEHLFVAVFLARAPQRQLASALTEAAGDHAEALLRDGLRRMRAAMAAHLEDMRLVFVEMLEFDGRHAPDLAQVFLPQALNFIERVRALPGPLRPYPPPLILRAFLGLFMSFIITQAFLTRVPGFEDDPKAFDRLGELLLHGLMEPPSSKSDR
jgi:AcrR family transcriptional regulator